MKKKNLLLALVFILGFALAAFVFYRPPGDSPALRAAREVAEEAVLTQESAREFFQAVAAGDFSAMAAKGKEMFVPGRKVADAAEMLAGYGTNSFPPFTVYVLFIENTPGKTRRVLLALDGQNRVESFLAEEMPVIE